MSFTAEKLFDLLPAIYRIRDAERGGPLQALLSVVADQIAVLEEDLQQLEDDQFIETCAEWVVPYIGDLIGFRGLHGVVPKVVSARAEVANTIGYRRRKGTAAMLEQLAHDVTGWHARVVEFFEMLATTQHMNHIRPTNAYAPDLRRWEPLERLNTAFETTAHTVDVRSIADGDGKYNIPNIGIFLWRLTACPLTNSPACRLNGIVTDRRFLFSPLGNNTQLFSGAETEDEVAHLAEPINVPELISRRVLDAHLSEYYGREKSFSIQSNGHEIPIDQICVCNLSDVPGGDWAHQPPQNRVAVDPVLGRIHFGESIALQDPRVTFHYGFAADLGGGEYERQNSFDANLAKVARVITVPQVDPPVETIADALSLLGSQNGIIEIANSDRHELPNSIRLAPNQRLELRAANRCRPLLELTSDISISGDADSELVLNGLLIPAHGLQVPNADNALRRLRLSHCTLVPGRSLTLTGEPQQPDAVSLTVALPSVQVELDHCIVGSLRVTHSAHVRINDSVIDATSDAALTYADDSGTRPGAPLRINDSTVIGRVHTVALELASNAIFVSQSAASGTLKEPLFSERKQSGCVRFSFLPDGARVPRRFRCQPDLAIGQAIEDAKKINPNLSPAKQKLLAVTIRAWLKPNFTDLRYGQAGYAQLRTSTPLAIRAGADDESEMGAFHELHQPQRETNLRVRLEEYLRLGLEAGVFYAT